MRSMACRSRPSEPVGHTRELGKHRARYSTSGAYFRSIFSVGFLGLFCKTILTSERAMAVSDEDP
jgi:hypothetical protein